MDLKLKAKRALVTGASKGIGKSCAMVLAQEGCEVLLVSRDGVALKVLAAEIKAATGVKVDYLSADLSAKGSAKTVSDWAGDIDILVNNAGMRSYEPLADSTSDVWNQIIAVNLLSYVYMAREALPSLRQSKTGSIVNVSSTHAFHPRVGMGQYDVTKAGIVSLTKTLAYEEAQHQVRVNAICPGATLTPFHIKRAVEARKSGIEIDHERYEQNLLKRWADPVEIAYPILWLASSEASFITGSCLMADAGTLG